MLDLTGHWIGVGAPLIFGGAYAVVILEERLGLRKSVPVLVAARPHLGSHWHHLCPARATSWGGRRPGTCVPISRSTRWKWPSGDAAGVWMASSITPTGACNTSPSPYTERLAKAGLVASVGSHGIAYNNALAEAFNGLYKAADATPRSLVRA